MIESIIKGFEVWTDAQGVKSKGRIKSIDNIRLDGIAKLRELILDLAVRGKLIPQDPYDEPADELLKRIDLEKIRLAKEEKIRIVSFSDEIEEKEIPYTLPLGWKWTYIRNIGHDWGQKIPSKVFSYIDVSAIDNKKGILIEPTILESSVAPSRARKLVRKGTVIYSTVRPYLNNICVISENITPEPIASTAFAILHPYLEIDSRYVLLFLRSPVFTKYVESIQIGIAYPAINDKQFFGGLFPLPPCAEQRKIVEKVYELMALCDKLEQQQTTNLTTHQHLVKSLLATLTNAANADELQAAWQKLAAHFDTLFSTEDSIEQLKQTLLELAIMGRFKTQSDVDTPVTETYNKIQEELSQENGKEFLNKLKRDKSTIEPSDFHFPIPKSWRWCELQDLAVLFNGKAHEQYVDENGDFILVNSSFVSSEGKVVKYVSSQLTPLTKGNIAIVMSDVPGGKALVKCYLIEIDRKYSLNQRIGGIDASSHINIQFLFLVLNRNKYYLQYDDGKKQTNLKKIQILSCPVPLPPIEEQQRIVEKVTELYQFCESLKEKINKTNEINLALSKTIIKVI